jgi:hypothetical protein
LLTLQVLPLGNLLFDKEIQGTALCFLHMDPPSLGNEASQSLNRMYSYKSKEHPCQANSLM